MASIAWRAGPLIRRGSGPRSEKGPATTFRRTSTALLPQSMAAHDQDASEVGLQTLAMAGGGDNVVDRDLRSDSQQGASRELPALAKQVLEMSVRRVAAALFVLTVAVYVAVWPNEFVRFDDGIYLFDNVVVWQGLSEEGLGYAFTTFDSANWIPLTWISYECDVSLFGVSPTGTHAVNVLLHAANVVLLYFFLILSTQAIAPSALAAAMYAVHPLHVESVAWASERKDVLSTFWLLVALLAYRRYAARPNLANWTFVTLAFACGLLAKSTLVTLPILLCLLDWWPLRRIDQSNGHRMFPWRLIVEKLPWLVMSLAIGVVTIVAQRSTGNTNMLPETSLPLRVANAIDSYGWYVWKTVCPTSLIAMYFHPLAFPPLGRLAVSFLACGALSVASVALRRRCPAFCVGWWWFVISLIPMIGLLQVGMQSHADRYAYMPHLGLLTGIAFLSHHWFSQHVRLRWVPRFLSAVVLITWGTLTVVQITHWKTTDALWQHAFAVDPENWFVNSSLSSLRIEQGNLDEAEAFANRAIQVRPHEPTIYSHLGMIWLKRGSPEQAAASYRRGVEANPASAEAWCNLSKYQQLQGDLTNAAASLAKSIELDPFNPRWHNQLGMVEVARGDDKAALDHVLDAVQVDRAFSIAHFNAALLYVQAGQDQLAKDHFLEAARVSPYNAGFRAQAGLVKESEGDLTTARNHYRAALRYDALNSVARKGLERLESEAPTNRGRETPMF
jgi:Flp pilus assembly protein TadD